MVIQIEETHTLSLSLVPLFFFLPYELVQPNTRTQKESKHKACSAQSCKYTTKTHMWRRKNISNNPNDPNDPNNPYMPNDPNGPNNPNKPTLEVSSILLQGFSAATPSRLTA